MPLALTKQGPRVRAHSDDVIDITKSPPAASSRKPPLPSTTISAHIRANSTERLRRENSNGGATKRLMALSNNLDQKIKDALQMCTTPSTTSDEENRVVISHNHSDDNSCFSNIPKAPSVSTTEFVEKVQTHKSDPKATARHWATTRSKSSDHAELHSTISHTHTPTKPPLVKTCSDRKPAIRRHTFTTLPLNSNPAAIINDSNINVFDESKLPTVKHVFNHSTRGVHVAHGNTATAKTHPTTTSSTGPNKSFSTLDQKIEETMRLCEQLSVQATISNPAAVALDT